VARVVVVDDEADIRTLMRFSLGSHPYLDVVGEAGDGNQAVDVVKRLKPDLLILDIQMPRKSGLEALPEIAQLSPDTKVIVFSCLDGSTAATALARGAHVYIEKGHGDIDDVLDAALRLTASSGDLFPLRSA
jgi:DNA-binding NarL/FixJ family response regulator